MIANGECGNIPKPSYTYTPLRQGEIRLLRLRPGLFEDDLKFEILHHTLHTSVDMPIERQQTDTPIRWRALETPEGRPFYERSRTRSEPAVLTYKHPEDLQDDSIIEETAQSRFYEALSYTWGNSSGQQLAFVLDDDSEQRTLPLGRTLSLALRHLRFQDAARNLWVDAVCIHQDDLEERAAQVKRMRHIYDFASRVVVWLGESSDDSSSALRDLEYLGRQIEITADAWIFRAFDPPASEPSWIAKRTALPYTSHDWQAIESLFQRSWFDRLWVLQEVIANPRTTIQCGQDSIDWYFLRRAIVGLDERVGVPATLSYRLNNKVDIAFGSRGTFRDVLFVARQHLCQDPRDKLYGVLGLIGPRLRDMIVPSYEKSSESLYKDIFLLHSSMTGRLDLLTQCFVNEDLRSSPSWVPDWRSFPYAFRAPEPGYQASGMSKAEFREVLGNRLEVTGILIDKVAFAPDSSDVDPESLVTYIRELKPADLHEAEYVTGEPMLKAWVRTLAMDLLRERAPSRFFPSYNEWQEKILGILDATDKKSLAIVESFGNLVRDTLTDMGFIRTTRGYIGFGPYAVEPDYCLCVVLGVPTPLVIRPNGNDTYQVLGWAYIHGLMDSEALLGPLPEGWVVKQRDYQLRQLPRYVNTVEDRWQLDDPRLGELPPGWRRAKGWKRRLNRPITPDDPVLVDFFQNIETEEMINYDPRMTAEVLRQRGVKLQTLTFT